MPTTTTKRASQKKPALRKELNLHQPVPKQRRLRLPAYRPFRLKRVHYPGRLPSAWSIGAKTLALLWRNRWVFLGIVGVYTLLSLIFVRGLSAGVDVDNLKKQFDLGIGGGTGQVITGLSVFSALVASSGGGTASTASAYQVILVFIVSLAAIWAVRQIYAGKSIRIRDAFYRGMYPLVPFTLVAAVILLQAVPFLIGGGLFSMVVTSGIAVSTLEVALWGALFAVLSFISVYMLCSSLFALYIVTLPDMTPMRALRSARQLVRYRRGQIFRKLLFLLVALLVIGIIVTLPFIFLLPNAAPWVMFLLTTTSLVVVHAYMYTVYKELLA